MVRMIDLDQAEGVGAREKCAQQAVRHRVARTVAATGDGMAGAYLSVVYAPLWVEGPARLPV